MDTIIVLYTYSNCPAGRKYKDKKDAISDGGYEIWSEARIKGGFNFGNGTTNDFNRYAKDNLLKRISEKEFWEIVDKLPDAANHHMFYNECITTKWE
jgi:hypothetical protein